MKNRSYPMTLTEKIGIITVSLLLVFSAATAQVTYEKTRGGYRVRMVEKFAAAPGGELKMSDLEGDLQISGSAASAVEVIQEFFFEVDTEAQAKEAFEDFRAEVKQAGNQIEIKGTDASLGRGSVYKHSYDVYVLAKKLTTLHREGNLSARFEVHLPTTFNVDASTVAGNIDLTLIKGQVKLETTGGDIEVNDLTGSVAASTAGGDVTARKIEGTTNLKTSGGDVELTDGRTGPFNLETAGGEIMVQATQGEVRASTSGGDVEARRVEGNVDLRTSGGSITLQEVKGSSHRASTSGGDVEARSVEGNVDLKTSGGMIIANRVTGKVYGRTSGGDMEVADVTGDVDISTAGGDLDIRTIKGRFVGKTSGGDVRARVEQGGRLVGPIRLSTSGGEIELLLPATVQATVSARIVIEGEFAAYHRFDIHSDFRDLKIEEVELEGKRRYRTLEIQANGDLNGGGPLIELETVNGDIYIARGN